jgi:hypothetical protein
VARPSPLRPTLVALFGIAVYYALLGFLYARAPYAAMPHWWRAHLVTGPLAVMSWFTMLNLGGAALAAIPVGIGVVLSVNSRRNLLGLIIGVLPALYMVVGGLTQFGVPTNLVGWVVDMAQFLAVSLAVVAAVALIESCPLTTRSSGP